MTPAPEARVLEATGASAQTPEADADRLIASFGLRAYSEARWRQRQAESSQSSAHWSDVANLVAQRRAERRAAGPSTRMELESGLAPGGEAVGAGPPVRFFEVDPLDELKRVLAVNPQRFRLQFFGVAADLGPAVLSEIEIEAPDASGAIREAVAANWPTRAVGLRLLDREGREIYERLKADL